MKTLENRKARHRYQIATQLSAGIVLNGNEVKAIRQGKASLQEAYCFFKKGELFIKNMHISVPPLPSGHEAFAAAEPTRVRKLMLKKKELTKWYRQRKEKGYTIVPLRFFFNERGWGKVTLGLARGMKNYEKKAALRDREDKRTLARLSKRLHTRQRTSKQAAG